MKKYKNRPMVPISEQNPIEKRDLADVIDQIGCSIAFALKSKRKWEKALWYDHACALTVRLLYIREISLLKYTNNRYFYKKIAQSTQYYLNLILRSNL